MKYNHVKAPILSVMVVGESILALVRRGDLLSLVMFDKELKAEGEITSLNASKGFILNAEEDKLLLSIDDKLVLVEGGNQKIVLKSHSSKNFFWHATRAEGEVFVQEYGEPPTGIFASEDFRRWKKLVVNSDLDKRSKHFHYITYDSQRKWLIATLGDGCLTRVVYSEDFGEKWRPLYRGPWQFVPVEVLEDRVIFGMDSGIVRGGIGLFNPIKGSWNFIFLKWHDENIRFAQICTLKLLDNGIWMAGLGAPQAIIISRDLRKWYLLYADGFDEQFNPYMNISEGKEFVACSTGKSLLLFKKEKQRDLMLKAVPTMSPYKAYRERLIGIGFNLKHVLMSLWPAYYHHSNKHDI